MAELTTEQKLEIVSRLARFETPSDIVAWFQAEYGETLSLLQVGRYDPTRNQYSASEQLRTAFGQIRKAFVDEALSHPIANQGYRIGILQRQLDQALKRKNTVEARACLEQAAKEMGGLYSNIRHVNLPGGGAGTELTPIERREALAKLIDESFGAMKRLAPSEVVVEGEG